MNLQGHQIDVKINDIFCNFMMHNALSSLQQQYLVFIATVINTRCTFLLIILLLSYFSLFSLNTIERRCLHFELIQKVHFRYFSIYFIHVKDFAKLLDILHFNFIKPERNSIFDCLIILHCLMVRDFCSKSKYSLTTSCFFTSMFL